MSNPKRVWDSKKRAVWQDKKQVWLVDGEKKVNTNHWFADATWTDVVYDGSWEAAQEPLMTYDKWWSEDVPSGWGGRITSIWEIDDWLELTVWVEAQIRFWYAPESATTFDTHVTTNFGCGAIEQSFSNWICTVRVTPAEIIAEWWFVALNLPVEWWYAQAICNVTVAEAKSIVYYPALSNVDVNIWERIDLYFTCEHGFSLWELYQYLGEDRGVTQTSIDWTTYWVLTGTAIRAGNYTISITDNVTGDSINVAAETYGVTLENTVQCLHSINDAPIEEDEYEVNARIKLFDHITLENRTAETGETYVYVEPGDAPYYDALIDILSARDTNDIAILFNLAAASANATTTINEEAWELITAYNNWRSEENLQALDEYLIDTAGEWNSIVWEWEAPAYVVNEHTKAYLTFEDDDIHAVDATWDLVCDEMWTWTASIETLSTGQQVLAIDNTAPDDPNDPTWYTINFHSTLSGDYQTICAWVKPEFISNDWLVALYEEDWYNMGTSDTNNWFFTAGNGGSDVFWPTARESWHLMTLTVNGGYCEFFIDGEWVNSTSATATYNLNEFHIGRTSDTAQTPDWWNWMIGDVIVDDYVWDINQIQTYYNKTKDNYPIVPITQLTNVPAEVQVTRGQTNSFAVWYTPANADRITEQVTLWWESAWVGGASINYVDYDNQMFGIAIDTQSIWRDNLIIYINWSEYTRVTIDATYAVNTSMNGDVATMQGSLWETLEYNTANNTIRYVADYYTETSSADYVNTIANYGWDTDWTRYMDDAGYATRQQMVEDIKAAWIANATITHDTTNGEITMQNGQWSFTIQDKNLWATNVYDWWDTLDEYNCGYLYQWWNNNWFSSDASATISTSNVQVDASTYWPWNYYTGTDFIIEYEDWSSVSNDNLWWDTTDTDAARQWPAPSWYHVPSATEWENFVNMYMTIKPSETDGESFATYFHMPFAGYRNYSYASLYDQGSNGYYWSSSPSSASSNYARSLYLDSSNVYASSSNHRASARSIRCFKNS